MTRTRCRARILIVVGLAGLWLGWATPARARDAGPALPETPDAGAVTSIQAASPDQTTAKAGPAGLESVDPPTTGSDLGSMLLEMLLALAAVCLLAYAALRWGLQRLIGPDPADDGPIEVLARQPLGTDRAISVVRIGSRRLIVGESDAGLTRLGELDDEDDSLDHDHL